MSSIGVESIGKEVLCPKCGKMGKVSVFHTYAKGYKYTYLVVEHEEKYRDRKTKRKCIIGLVGKERADKVLRKEEAKPQVSMEAYVDVEVLRQENERLREENMRLRQENEQLRMAIQNVYNARIVQAREKEREALRLKFIAKKGGLSLEISRLANEIMHSLVSEDWVAIRLSDFESSIKGIGLWQ
jgi:regulator of replication initiation timing